MMHQSQSPTLPTRAPHYEVRFRPAILDQAGERIFKKLTGDSHERRAGSRLFQKTSDGEQPIVSEYSFCTHF